MAGSGGAAAGGTGGTTAEGGAGGSAPTSSAHRWLAFSQDATYVYDVTKYPASDALISIGDGGLGPWSPDGQKLIFGDKGAYYVSDMSTDEPRPPTILVTPPAPPSSTLGYGVQPINWLADSKSVAMIAGTTLSTFDPAQAAPGIHVITSTLKAYSFAPKGSKIIYLDAAGAFVVDVSAGIPGASVPVNVTGSTIVWAPTGLAVATLKTGNLALTDLSAVPPVTSMLTAAATATPSVSQIAFSPNGKKLAFCGNQERAHSDVYVIDLGGAAGNVTRVYPALSDTGSAVLSTGYRFSAWSLDGKWLTYSASDNASAAAAELFAVDVSGSVPATPVKFPGAFQYWIWSPVSDSLFGLNISVAAGSSFNPQTPAVAPVTLFTAAGPISNVTLNGTATALGYLTKYDLHLVDAVNPQNPPADIVLDAGYDGTGTWAWSADSKFIAVTDALTSYVTPRYQIRLLRTDDITASTPIVLHPSTTTTVRFAWQP